MCILRILNTLFRMQSARKRREEGQERAGEDSKPITVETMWQSFSYLCHIPVLLSHKKIKERGVVNGAIYCRCSCGHPGMHRGSVSAVLRLVREAASGG